MYVLGIETSCDETAASIVKDGRRVLSNIVASSISLHKQYGGVVPEIASRKQLETIVEVAEAALKKARVKLSQLGLISVTDGPGLLGSLLVGISFAKSVSFSRNIPLVGINHLHSHIYSAFLNRKNIQLPFVALVVSGGHTSLFYVKDFHRIEIMGLTLDDACGEAFDKVAKILKLGYPGGPLIEKLAKGGDSKKIRFGCSKTKKPLNFSFSGVKTAVLYYVQRQPARYADVAASFQDTVIDVLIEKSFLACRMKKANRLVLGGGVLANNRLRQEFSRAAQKDKVSIYLPEREFCTDNAAMVAGLGYQLFKNGNLSSLDLGVNLN